MRFSVRQNGAAEKTKDIVIRNPKATVANLRAAIAISFRTPPAELRLQHATADLTDMSKLLTDIGMNDGDVITIVSKREREATSTEETGTGESATTTVEAGGEQAEKQEAKDSAPTATAPAPVEVKSTPAVEPPASLPTGDPRHSQALVAALAGINPEAAVLAQERLRKTQEKEAARAARKAAKAAAASGEGATDHSGSDNREDDEPEDYDEGEDNIYDDGDRTEEEEDEVMEMMNLLIHIPNLNEVRDRLLSDPQSVLEEIRTTDPHLFQLITTHQYDFLELVHHEDLLSELLGADSDDYEEYEDDFEYEDEEDGDVVNLGQIPMNNSGGVREALLQFLAANNGGAVEGIAAAPAADEAVAAPASSPNQRYLDREPSEDDRAKIEGLMELGFSREQCQVAFYRCNRSIERAASLLFDDPPQL